MAFVHKPHAIRITSEIHQKLCQMEASIDGQYTSSVVQNVAFNDVMQTMLDTTYASIGKEKFIEDIES